MKSYPILIHVNLILPPKNREFSEREIFISERRSIQPLQYRCN